MAQTKPKIVEAEEVKNEDEKFLEKIVEDGSESGKLSRNSIRYLKNVGDPSSVLVDVQRHVWWVDKDAKKRVVEIVVRDREGQQPGSRELNLAEQLRLTSGEKAILYFQPDGSINKKILDINHTFEVVNYPHVLGVVFSDGADEFTKKRRYNILVGEVAKITNQKDFERLWKSHGFLDEVDEEGNVIRENAYTINRKNPPKKVIGSMPTKFEQMSEKDVQNATADPSYKKNDLQEQTDDSEFDLIEDEKDNSSATI